MAREDLFSKFNIKDYNNQLETILENKSFSESTKNILLNILYKMETAYDDYKKVKVWVDLKKEILENIIGIIENNCKQIEIIKPKINGETKLGNKKYLIEKNNKKIISYPNEKNVFYALNHLDDEKFKIDENFIILKEPMEILLNSGYISDKEEIIRDFDGWTWNILPSEIENHTYNLVYQNIRILLGNEFLQNCINNKMDFINEFEKNLNKIEIHGKETNIANQIYKLSILESIKAENNKKEHFLKLKEETKIELAKMEKKKDYLLAIANSKKVIAKEIKQIDEIINSNKLLRNSFIEENKKLEEDKKIFSLSEYAEIINEKRQKLLKDLECYSAIMKPMNFVKKKEEISNRYKLLSEINFKANIDEEINKELIILQINFLKLLNEKFKKVELKKEIIDYIYLFRYYKLIYINSNKQVKEVEELKKEIRKTEKHLITKACKLKAVNILCQDIEKNYELVSEILSYNIIELEDVSLEFQKHDKNITVTVFDEDTIEDSIIYDGNEELNVKFNKKMKLFN